MRALKLFFILLSITTAYLTVYKYKYIQGLSGQSMPVHVSDMNQSKIKITGIIEQSLLMRTGKAVHSVSFTNINDSGDLIALWFSGESEAAPNVQIWQSYYIKGHWTKPTLAINQNNARHYMIRTFGNPVIYKQGDDLHLLVVVSTGGWALSRLDHFISKNHGLSWKEQGVLAISPFLNISTLGRNPPVVKDGKLYLPVYHECLRQYPELLVIDNRFNVIDEIRIHNSVGLMQPALLVEHDNLLGLLRNFSGYGNNNLFAIDSGTQFNKYSTNLRNFNSAIALTSLSNHRYLLVYNEGTDRSHLKIAVSKDFMFWETIYNLEINNNQEEFSYPAVLLSNGILHVMYTYKRTNIKHVMLKLDLQ